MKSKRQIQMLAASLILIVFLATASAQPVPKQTPPVNPAAGQTAPGPIDPATGLPRPRLMVPLAAQSGISVIGSRRGSSFS